MDNRFFEQPILNSPYEYPARHWELDPSGQPTQLILEKRRKAEFITPIPKPKKRKGAAADQQNLLYDDGIGLSTQQQQYDPTSIINALRIPVKSAATALKASPVGSSTPITTKKVSSFATPISSGRMIPTKHSRPPSKPRSMKMPGQRSTAILPGHSISPRPVASQ